MSGTKVILVGSSDGLNGKSLGKAIDKFDKIIRFNWFKTKRYEEDVGEKTTHWMIGASQLNINRLNEFMPNVSGLEKVWIKFFPDEPESKQRIINTIKSHTNLTDDMFVIVPIPGEIFNELQDKLKQIPSTGIMGLEMVKRTFQDSEIYIVGIGDGTSKKYYDSVSPLAGHNWKKEKELIDSWVKQGLIKRLENEIIK